MINNSDIIKLENCPHYLRKKATTVISRMRLRFKSRKLLRMQTYMYTSHGQMSKPLGHTIHKLCYD